MRTVRCGGRLGGVCPGGVCLGVSAQGGVSTHGGVYLGVCLPDTPLHGQNDRHVEKHYFAATTLQMVIMSTLYYYIYLSVAHPGFSKGALGAPTPKVGRLIYSFTENCMKMKECGPHERGRESPGASWDPPLFVLFFFICTIVPQKSYLSLACNSQFLKAKRYQK